MDIRQNETTDRRQVIEIIMSAESGIFAVLFLSRA
jgi:hypothetical protein